MIPVGVSCVIISVVLAVGVSKLGEIANNNSNLNFTMYKISSSSYCFSIEFNYM